MAAFRFGISLVIAALCWSEAALAQTPICASGPVQVSVNFAGGGRHTCRIGEGGEVILGVVPEGEPINPSPWYAFRLDAAQETHLHVTLDYGAYEHRYAPVFTRDGVTWQPVPDSNVSVTADEHRASIDLEVAPGMTIVAAQPIETPAATLAWARATLAPRGWEEVEYGRSVDDRPLIAYRGGEGERLVVVMTRQHPPEATGAEAFRAFVERIMADTPQANDFRSNHRILAVPMPNPDGVVRGHWRWGNGGIDLNRDWRAFAQPETRMLRDLILNEARGRQTIAFFDFHSTRRSAIYAPPLDSASPNAAFLPFLRARLDGAMARPLPRTFSHSETGNTSKRWSLEALRAPGLTIEIADQESAERVALIGRTVADALMEHGVAER